MKISSYMNNMNPIIEKNDAKVQKENKQANEKHTMEQSVKLSISNDGMEHYRKHIQQNRQETMRTVDVATLTQNIKEMCIEANHFLSEDMKTAFTKAEQQEKAPLGKQILQQLQQNMDIAVAG